MNNDQRNATFTLPQFELLAAAIVEPLAESVKAITYGGQDKGRLRVIFEDPENVNLESKNNPDFPLAVLCSHIALVLIRLAAEGFPLPPYKN